MNLPKTEIKIKSSVWNWTPPLPIEPSDPLFYWPPRPIYCIRWLLTSGFVLSNRMVWVLMAIGTWLWLQPPLEQVRELDASWIVFILVRNIAYTTFVATGLQLYFHSWKMQGETEKFDPRDLPLRSNVFLFGNQLWDNVFWTLASGVTLWTAYEVWYLWSYANGYLPQLTWSDNPVWFCLLFVLLPIWGSTHFYLVHRLLHWPPLYKTAHALHHRNVIIGPWSGMSMHPLEHLIYLSGILIFLILPSHPTHMYFLMFYTVLAAITSHTGFRNLMLTNKLGIRLGSFHHQLHHRYFKCNYGNADIPWDLWFGSFHDGMQAATKRLRQ